MTPATTESHLRETVLRVLGSIAPEADLSQLNPAVTFRDQLDIDSVDFLNFLIAIDEELGIGIPESDYGRLRTLDGCVAYLLLKISP
jgi:acyl carrier protein